MPENRPRATVAAKPGTHSKEAATLHADKEFTAGGCNPARYRHRAVVPRTDGPSTLEGGSGVPSPA